jgi:hypothetical protein
MSLIPYIEAAQSFTRNAVLKVEAGRTPPNKGEACLFIGWNAEQNCFVTLFCHHPNFPRYNLNLIGKGSTVFSAEDLIKLNPFFSVEPRTLRITGPYSKLISISRALINQKPKTADLAFRATVRSKFSAKES